MLVGKEFVASTVIHLPPVRCHCPMHVSFPPPQRINPGELIDRHYPLMLREEEKGRIHIQLRFVTPEEYATHQNRKRCNGHSLNPSPSPDSKENER